jgi:hypothetical protein
LADSLCEFGAFAVDCGPRSAFAQVQGARAQPAGGQTLIKTFQPDNSAFVIGLTGHQDVAAAQLPSLLEEIVSFLRELKQHLPDTDVRLLLDARHAASLAIARATLALDIAIDAVIDGASADISPVQDLLQHPGVHWIEVAAAHSANPQCSPASMLADAVNRRCSLLLALWDGRSSTVPDDTAAQVFHFLGVGSEQGTAPNRIEISTVANDLDVTARLVFWVAAPDCIHNATGNRQQPCYLLSAEDNVLEVQDAMPASLRRRLADLNEYNLEFDRFTAAGSLVHSSSLMPADPDMLLTPDVAILLGIDRQFVKADSLAGYMQLRSDRLFNMFSIAALAMGFAYLIYEKISESNIVLLFYMVILFISLFVYYLFQTKRWFSKYLAYRALAETLRVRFYLALAGIERHMHSRELTALTGIYRFPGFGWMSFALDSIESAAGEASHSGESRAFRARVVDRAWVEGQYRYFARKVAAMHRHHFWIGRLKGGAFLVGVIVLSAMYMFHEGLNHIDMRTGLPLKNVLTFVSGSLAVALGVWELRQNKMAVQELLWQYRNQLSEFQRARTQLQRTTNPARWAEILQELGENSLMEIHLWAIHRYHREHAPPSAH